MTLTRRYLVVTALALWLGGFTFYAAVVVPVGTDRLGRTGQGFITRDVTAWLNLVGLAALVPLGWDAWSAGRRGRPMRLVLWLVLAATLAVLAALHPRLVELLDDATEHVQDRRSFLFLHKTYLWVSTGQWAAGLLHLALTLRDWRRADQTP